MSNVHGELPTRYEAAVAAGRRTPATEGWHAPQPIGRTEQTHYTDDGKPGGDWRNHPLGHRMDDAKGWRTCWYCGSMHPDDLLAAIDAQGWTPHFDMASHPEPAEGEDWSAAYSRWVREQHDTKGGIRLSESDWKYGWPHKFYIEGLPNPQAGQQVCSLGFSGQGLDEAEHMIGPARDTTRAKFYTEHLADATDFGRLAERLTEYLPNITWERDAEGRIVWRGVRGEGVR